MNGEMKDDVSVGVVLALGGLTQPYLSCTQVPISDRGHQYSTHFLIADSCLKMFITALSEVTKKI